MSSSSTWSVSIRAWFSRRRRQSSLTASVLVAWPPVRRVAGTASAWLIGCGVPEVGVGMEARILGLVKVGSSGDGLGGSWVAMGGQVAGDGGAGYDNGHQRGGDSGICSTAVTAADFDHVAGAFD